MRVRIQTSLIITPLQRGENAPRRIWNRFSGFLWRAQTAEAVQGIFSRSVTSLKRGVNERTAHYQFKLLKLLASMKPKRHAHYLGLVLVAGSAAITSCNRKADAPPSAPTAATKSWTNMLTEARATVLTAKWDQAENSYAELRSKAIWPPEELALWMQLQADILEQTKADPLKDQLRLTAIQQFQNHPEVSRRYLGWLKEGLATNLFLEPRVAEKARKIVADLEKVTR